VVQGLGGVVLTGLVAVLGLRAAWLIKSRGWAWVIDRALAPGNETLRVARTTLARAADSVLTPHERKLLRLRLALAVATIRARHYGA
jgi:hypothetical protein